MRVLKSLCRSPWQIAAVCAGLMLGGLAGPTIGHTQSNPTVTVGLLESDLCCVPVVALSQDQELQAKHGIEVKLKFYTTVPVIWTAFGAGEIDLMPGSPYAHASLAARGVPTRIISTYATGNADLIGKMDKITSADELRGKRVTAPTTGLWLFTVAQIKAKFGLEPGNGYELIQAPNMLSGISQVLAGTADIAMGWEPDTTRVLQTYPELKVVLQSADLRPAGEPTHLQVVAAFDHVDESTAKKFTAALREAIEKVKADPVAAEELFWKITGSNPGDQKGVFAEAISSGRYNLDAHELTSEEKTLIRSDISAIVPLDKLPDSFVGE